MRLRFCACASVIPTPCQHGGRINLGCLGGLFWHMLSLSVRSCGKLPRFIFHLGSELHGCNVGIGSYISFLLGFFCVVFNAKTNFLLVKITYELLKQCASFILRDWLSWGELQTQERIDGASLCIQVLSRRTGCHRWDKEKRAILYFAARAKTVQRLLSHVPLFDWLFCGGGGGIPRGLAKAMRCAIHSKSWWMLGKIV